MNRILTLNAPGICSSLESYIGFVHTLPMLSSEEEFRLATDLQENGNLDSAKQLVMAHLRFVVKVARGYRGYGLAENDLIQEGNLGLMKAVKKFDPTVGVRLVTFAIHWIKAEIHEYIIRNWRIVKVATTKAQRKLFFNLRSSKQSSGWMSRDEIREIASKLNVEETDVETMETRLAANDCGAETVSKKDSESNPLTVEVVSEEYDPSVAYQLFQTESFRKNQLYKAMSSLDERTRDIIVSRWLKSPKDTLATLAKKYKVSGERIRQLEQDAMGKIRTNIIEHEKT
ncbi:MAG: RNA polymerase sigma factor RpoH [Pseudomonadota bacterium]|nr:RNA polymerase sigma factor RpoH [Pseudomonadota bacterium]